MKQRKIVPIGFVVLVLLLSFMGFGCIKKTTGAVTPWERTSTDNALFASSLNAAEQGAELVANNGLLAKNKAAAVITLMGQSADIHERVTALLKEGHDKQNVDVPAITALIQSFQQKANELINDQSLHIVNPNTQRTISADIQIAVNLANSLLSDVQLLLQNPSHSSVPVPPAARSRSQDDMWLAFMFLPIIGLAAGVDWSSIVSLIIQAGPLAVEAFMKLESLLNLGPDEKQNIANAFASADTDDEATKANASAWLKANGFPVPWETAPPTPPAA